MKDTPGTPRDPEKPSQNPKKITFRIQDLQLISSTSSEGYNYLTFIHKDEFIISIRKWEYLELLDRVYSLMEDEDGVIVDVCPNYEIIQENAKLSGVVFDVEKQTKIEFDKEVPHYEAYNLLSNLFVDIEDSKFNLN